MPIIIGDTHGCFKTFEALLKKLPDDKIILTGDMLDRGPRVKELVQFVMDHSDLCSSVLGNHEQMAISVLENIRFGNSRDWFGNGGFDTIKSYHPRLNKEFANKIAISNKHLDFIKSLPLFIEEENLFVSHSSYSGLYPLEQIADHANKFYGITWNRDLPREIPNKFHIFGHSPGNTPEIKSFYACIDTGAVYKNEGLGILTALQYPSMQIFTQENIDF